MAKKGSPFRHHGENGEKVDGKIAKIPGQYYFLVVAIKKIFGLSNKFLIFTN